MGPENESITIRLLSGEIMAVVNREELKNAFRNLAGFFQEKGPHLNYAGKIPKLVFGPATNPEIVSHPEMIDTLDAASLLLSNKEFKLSEYRVRDEVIAVRARITSKSPDIEFPDTPEDYPESSKVVQIPNAANLDLSIILYLGMKVHYDVFDHLISCSIDDLIDAAKTKLLELGQDPENTTFRMLIKLKTDTNTHYPAKKMPPFTRENLQKLYDAGDHIHSLDDVNALFED